ncbi:energy transducer TonB [Anatilimnocola aggregata]|nr:energy transducer TonB [Anatilimnocola aggregata]
MLAFPSVLEFQVRRGEAILIHAQMSAVAATQPDHTQEVEVSVEAVSLEPPPQVAVENAPIRDTLEPTPAVLPVVRSGDYEPTNVMPTDKPPATSVSIDAPAKVPPREKAKESPQQKVETAAKPLDRQIADQLRTSPGKVNVAAIRPSVAGAKVDELPRKLPDNREPLYPRDALLAGVEGKVMLRVQISAAGRVLRASVERSSGMTSFDESALDAVRDWRFTPAKRQGFAVAHEVFIPIRFMIRRG